MADCHADEPERDSSAVRAALEAPAAWDAAPGATVTEIAWALRRVGCETRLSGPEHLAIVRHGVVLAHLPLSERLRSPTLRALLATLGVSPDQLAEYLTAPET